MENKTQHIRHLLGKKNGPENTTSSALKVKLVGRDLGFTTPLSLKVKSIRPSKPLAKKLSKSSA